VWSFELEEQAEYYQSFNLHVTPLISKMRSIEASRKNHPPADIYLFISASNVDSVLT